MTDRPSAFDTFDEKRVSDEEQRWEVIESALGSIEPVGHARATTPPPGYERSATTNL